MNSALSTAFVPTMSLSPACALMLKRLCSTKGPIYSNLPRVWRTACADSFPRFRLQIKTCDKMTRRQTSSIPFPMFLHNISRSRSARLGAAAFAVAAVGATGVISLSSFHQPTADSRVRSAALPPLLFRPKADGFSEDTALCFPLIPTVLFCSFV